MAHRCLAAGCLRSVDDRFLMCGSHWRMVPPALQRAVYAAYVPGQTAASASEAWHKAADDAVLAVRQKEGR